MNLTDITRPRLEASLQTILTPLLAGKTPKPKVEGDTIAITVSAEIDGDINEELRTLAKAFGGKVSYKRSGDGVRVLIS